ncbi:MAG: hypothetical protein M3Q03_02900 [Chloroflexota bacterium]|nr:hypothetical protein [Chloroflexota bacterium]
MSGGSGEAGTQVLIFGVLGQAVTATAVSMGRERRAAWALFGFGVAAWFTAAVASVAEAWLLPAVEGCTDFCGVGTEFLAVAFGAFGLGPVLLGGWGVVGSLEPRAAKRVLTFVAAVFVLVAAGLSAGYVASNDAEVRAAAQRFEPPPGFTGGGDGVSGNWACWGGECTDTFDLYSGPPLGAAAAKRVVTEHMVRRFGLERLPVTGGGRDQWNCRPLEEEMPEHGVLNCTALFTDGEIYYLAGLEVAPGEPTSLDVTVTPDPHEWLPG